MKGEYNQECNITSCQKPNSATWYNHFNHMYYCEECAQRLNNDEFNKREYQKLLGHKMCTNVNDVTYPVAVVGSGKSHSEIAMIKAALDKHDSPIIVASEEGIFERGITINPLQVLCDNIIRDASNYNMTPHDGFHHQSGRESRRARRKQQRKNK